MSSHPSCCWSVSGVLLSLCAASASAGDQLVVENVLIRVIEEVAVPAREAGAIAELFVREGETVRAGGRVGHLDDDSEKLQVRRAEVELEIARRESENLVLIELAAKSLELERQAAEEHEMTRRIAHHRAGNEVKVLAAQKQRDVARNELDRGLRSRETFADSISDSEIDGRRLAYEHAELSAQQAAFEHEVDGMLAEAEDLVRTTQRLAVERAELELSSARTRHEIASLNVPLRENQLQTMNVALERRRIISPIDGIVVELKRHAGEWIEPGETLARIVRLDRLRGEGFLSARLASRIERGANVRVLVKVDEGEGVECDGEITFVSPEIDPVNREVRVWAEFDNPGARLRPGMHATLTLWIEP